MIRIRTFAALVICICAVMMCAPKCSALYLEWSTEGTTLTVIPKGIEEGREVELSIDGGNSFLQTTPEGNVFKGLPEKTYYICARYKGSSSSVTDVYSAAVFSQERAVHVNCVGLRENSYRSGAIKVTVTNYDIKKNYIVSLDNGMTWTRMKARTVMSKGLCGGEYNAIVRVLGTKEDSGKIRVKVPYAVSKGYVDIRAPMILQNPELPTGCEVTSLTMALQFLGFKVDKVTLSDRFLEKVPYRTGDYRDVFVGDPKTKAGYGCYAPAIEKCAHKFLDSINGREFEIRNISGYDFDKVRSFIDMGYPVIIWGTIDMNEPGAGAVWKDAATGEIIKWVANEHCMLMTGYDLKNKKILVNDPLRGKVSYDESVFRDRYEKLESQAIVIVEVTG